MRLESRFRLSAEEKINTDIIFPFENWEQGEKKQTTEIADNENPE